MPYLFWKRNYQKVWKQAMIDEANGRFLKGHGLKHGMTNSLTYGTWEGMKRRCLNPKDKRFADYGGRGIKICKKWMEFSGFFSDMGVKPSGTSLDRWPDKNGNYEPGNCRWATPKQQQRNTRRCRDITWNGETLIIAEWAEKLNVSHETLRCRIRRGWTTERTFTTPFVRRVQR